VNKAILPFLFLLSFCFIGISAQCQLNDSTVFDKSLFNDKSFTIFTSATSIDIEVEELQTDFQFSIFDSNGRLVVGNAHFQKIKTKRYRTSLLGLQSGWYYLAIEIGDYTYEKMFEIKKK
jgi:hypothetical protein